MGLVTHFFSFNNKSLFLGFYAIPGLIVDNAGGSKLVNAFYCSGKLLFFKKLLFVYFKFLFCSIYLFTFSTFLK